jgi:hypothetical protein
VSERLSNHSQDWRDGYRAGRYENVIYVEGKSADFISGWLIGQRDRHDDELMATFDDSWADAGQLPLDDKDQP